MPKNTDNTSAGGANRTSSHPGPYDRPEGQQRHGRGGEDSRESHQVQDPAVGHGINDGQPEAAINQSVGPRVGDGNPSPLAMAIASSSNGMVYATAEEAMANSRWGYGAVFFPVQQADTASRQEEEASGAVAAQEYEVSEVVSRQEEEASGDAEEAQNGNDLDDLDVQVDASQTSTPVCGRCNSNTHVLAACMQMNSSTGRVPGCPVCNTVDHSLEQCTKYQALTLSDKVNLLVIQRANMPKFETPGDWSELDSMKTWLEEHSGELPACPFLPWSPEFAKLQVPLINEHQRVFDQFRMHTLLPLDLCAHTWEDVRDIALGDYSAVGATLRDAMRQREDELESIFRSIR